MKSVARMALKTGMVIASDVTNYKGSIVIPAGTPVDEQIIAKLERNSVICVDIYEDIDYAVTHFEKIRISEQFQHFERAYHEKLAAYKEMMSDFVTKQLAMDVTLLIDIYYSLRTMAPSIDKILDYLNNMLPNEDELTYTHCLNAALIAGVFSEWLGFEKERRDELILCGYFYDVGKLLIPDNILWKPDKLTDLEYMQIKTHPLTGYKLLENQPLPEWLKRCTLMHHECCDGTGYPSRLKKTQIDLYARIIAIVDAYEAMTSPRSYRESITPLQVVKRLEEGGKKRYDEDLLRPILKRIADTQIGFNVRLTNDTKWEVFVINPADLSRPILKKDEELLDLSMHPELDIVAVY